MVAWQSQGKQTEITELVNGGISINKLLSHTDLDSGFSKTINSISILDLTMQVFLDDFQEIALPASVKHIHEWTLHICIKDPVSITILF